MSLAAGLAAPLVLGVVFSGGFMVNEWSHGALAEATGLGHRHALDYGGMHCAPHDDLDLAGAHAAHMHARPVPHDACPGGSAVHGNGTMPGQPMGGGHAHA